MKMKKEHKFLLAGVGLTLFLVLCLGAAVSTVGQVGRYQVSTFLNKGGYDFHTISDTTTGTYFTSLDQVMPASTVVQRLDELNQK